jgi:hypothetical protein
LDQPTQAELKAEAAKPMVAPEVAAALAAGDTSISALQAELEALRARVGTQTAAAAQAETEKDLAAMQARAAAAAAVAAAMAAEMERQELVQALGAAQAEKEREMARKDVEKDTAVAHAQAHAQQQAQQRAQQQAQQQAQKVEKEQRRAQQAEERLQHAQQRVQQQAEQRAGQQVLLAAATAEVARWQALARQSDEWEDPHDPAHVLLSFVRSNFKREYDLVRLLQPHEKDRVLRTVRRIVEAFCAGLYPGDVAATTLQVAAGHRFLQELYHEWHLDDDADKAAERVWSSMQKLPLVGAGGLGGAGVEREFCWIFSQAIRDDSASIARACAILARGLKANLVGERNGTYPAGGVCWRGGGFNMAHRDFFTVGTTYRVPGFLATSLRQAVTNDFMDRAEAAGFPAVQWRIEFDAKGDPAGENLRGHRCKHVNELRVTHCPGEQEFLFQAYSVFTVSDADFSTAGTTADPHRITLAPALDNALEPEDLPLAPWF